MTRRGKQHRSAMPIAGGIIIRGVLLDVQSMQARRDEAAHYRTMPSLSCVVAFVRRSRIGGFDSWLNLKYDL